jgi:hypothetical protein
MMRFLVQKRSIVLGILLFHAVSDAAVRGEWDAEHLESVVTSRGENQRQLGFISERALEREWTPAEAFQAIYHHGHHHHGSSDQRRMMSNKMMMSMKSEMSMKMMMNTKAPTKRPTTKPTAMKVMIPVTKSPTKMKSVTRPPTRVSPVEEPTDAPITEEVPTGDAPTDAPITEEAPTGDAPTDAPIAEASAGGSRSGNHQAGDPPSQPVAPVLSPSSPISLRDDDDVSENDDTWNWWSRRGL